MRRWLLPILLVLTSAPPALAAPPFTCRASGDTWSIAGAPTRKLSCTLRCILRDGAGHQDTVSCMPTVTAGQHGDPVCEGFLLGRTWTSATLVSGECSAVEP